MNRIVIVSNRVADPSKAAQAGGVAVALSDVLTRRGGIWAGWDGRVADADTEGTTALQARRKRRSSIVTTSLTPAEHAGFYLGYANSVLWPVFHNRLDLAQFEAGFFDTYRDVNRRFARLVRPLVEPGDAIWVHDYHFIMLALELRKLGLPNPIGFFLHIPFPPSQSFMAIPEHRELAEAMAAYDLVGLQTRADVGNMLEYLQRGVDARLLTDGRVRAFDRIMAVESFPIGIEPRDFIDAEDGSMLVRGRPDMRRIIGIDRLDYSKGLPQKFRAFGRFLEIGPQYRNNVVLTQIAPPTRESVEAYADIRIELETLSGSINGRFGELDWVPIHYIHRSVARSRLVNIYRASHIGLVTPLRDGMNLVAKEYVAAQNPNDPGVLILSQFAGAAEEMKEALIVNPFNIEDMAQAMLKAIEMPRDERRQRHAKLLARITQNDVDAWADGFIATLAKQRLQDPVTGPSAQLRDILDRLGRQEAAQGRAGRQRGNNRPLLA